MNANSKHNTPTPGISMDSTNNETSALPERRHWAADGLLVAEKRKNQEQLRAENTFCDPLLTPQ